MSYYDLERYLGRYNVIVESIKVYDKAGDMSDIVFDVVVKFSDGERSGRTYYPCRGGKNPEMARAVLRACGYDLDKLGIEPLMADEKKLAGAELEADVQENIYNGNTRNQIAFLNPIRRAPTSEAAKRVNEILRKAKKANANDEL